MPEGDTIHRAADRLRPVLEGQVLQSCACGLAAVDDWQVVGREVARVEARGKNLLIHCAPIHPPAAGDRPDPRDVAQLPVTIWTHLGMTGRWRVQVLGAAEGSRVARTPGLRRELVLRTQTHVARCSSPERLKLLGPRGLLREPTLARLGPDLLDPGVDLDEAVTRLRALGAVELGDAIMRQSAVAGIGNVYKSELLFLAGLDPFAPVAALPPELLRALLERAVELMRANLEHGGPRRTRQGRRGHPGHGGRGPRLWVYERSGRPCPTCKTTLAMRRQGRLARSTYYCPRCQSGGATRTGGS